MSYLNQPLNPALRVGLGPEQTKFFTPEIRCSDGAAAPTYGSTLIVTPGSNGAYSIIGNWCFGFMSLVWGNSGTSGGSGATSTAYQLRLPVQGLTGSHGWVGDYNIGQAYVVAGDIVMGLVYMAQDGGIDDGYWCQINTPLVSKWGTATIANAGTSVTYTHGLNVTPDFVMATPQADVGSGVRWWVDTVGASTLKVNASGAVSGAKAFWVQARTNAVTWGPNATWTWPGLAYHLDIQFQYPIA